MLVRFFFALRAAGLPVSLGEFLTLLEALKRHLAFMSAEEFYFLARLTLVKDERHFDRYDRVFAQYFGGASERFAALLAAELPADWLKSLGDLQLSAAEMQKIQALGGWEELLETLRQRLAEQRERHEGGSKWIGTRGTSPFGADGYNPEGVRTGQDRSKRRQAVKVWDAREFRNLDDGVQLGTRNFKMALRRLRKFAREGAAEELDLDDTIRSTARNAGFLDLKMVPERHNAVKVLLFLDIGGSMDPHVRTCEEMFSAARSEFKHLEHFYFHNCPYERLWRDASRRHVDHTPTTQVLHTYDSGYKAIFVGDASMSPYEIMQPGGSVEHFNEEAGEVWLRRILDTYPKAAWLNPVPERYWRGTGSIEMIRRLLGGRMFPMTLEGLDLATRSLSK